ncbi:MAG: hypothetical protein PHV82_02380, partial [Victivallaceae bacterium]|nr:hypothetical protein [Victivallaceae bacterium]
DGQKRIAGAAEVAGQIREIVRIGSNVAFKVKWLSRNKTVPAGMPLITKSEKALPLTWRIAEVNGDTIKVEGVKPTIGVTALTPSKGKPGWYSLRPYLSRSGRFLIGRTVSKQGKVIGCVADVSDSMLKIENNGIPVKCAEFTGEVFEVASGDKFTVPLNLSWKAKQNMDER